MTGHQSIALTRRCQEGRDFRYPFWALLLYHLRSRDNQLLHDLAQVSVSILGHGIHNVAISESDSPANDILVRISGTAGDSAEDFAVGHRIVIIVYGHTILVGPEESGIPVFRLVIGLQICMYVSIRK